MKTHLFTCCVLLTLSFSSVSLKAQNFEWVKTFGGPEMDQGQDLSVDAFGNIYSIGFFSDTIAYDPNTGISEITSNGDYDIFIQKLSSSGQPIWVKSFGGSGWDIGQSITVDTKGNVYTTGYFQDSVDFDPGNGIAMQTSLGGTDVFIQKLDTSGNLLWVRTIGGAVENEFSYSISTDPAGNILTVGHFAGTVDFDPGIGSYNLTAVGGIDIFVLKMDPSGNFLWARSIGGVDNEECYSICTDNTGNVYTTGYFESTVDLDPGNGIANISSSGSRDIFVQKMDSSGNFQWGKAIGGSGIDAGNSLCVDASGNIILTGYFHGTVNFNPGGTPVNLNSVGESDIFILKLDTSGNTIWAKTFGGASFDRGTGIGIDALGNVYTSGFFSGTIDLSSGSNTVKLTSAGMQDIFLHQMDASGNLLFANAIGGPENDRSHALNISTSNQISFTGFYEKTADLGLGGGTNGFTSKGLRDIFVISLSQSLTGILQHDFGNIFSVYPNPSNGAVQLSFEQPLPNADITLTDLQGRVVLTQRLDGVSNETIAIEGPPGIYFLHVQTPKGQSVVKLVKQ